MSNNKPIYKYYAAGKEISQNKHEDIYSGKTDKLIRCPDNQPGICLGWISDHINVVDKKLDESDPVLIEILRVVELPIEKTYIIHLFQASCDPLSNFTRGAVYGYW